jgi:hypothetical protein|tara:strand:- start:236 stop:406 length:171 start_codon:yes stop_codon:yes gene_type:complete
MVNLFALALRKMVADAVKQFVEKVHFAQLIDQVSLLIQIDVHMLTKRIIEDVENIV